MTKIIETERKFLLKGLPKSLNFRPDFVQIEQGYVEISEEMADEFGLPTKGQCRIRQEIEASPKIDDRLNSRTVLCKKTPIGPGENLEEEHELDFVQGDELLRLSNRSLIKRRYVIQEGGLKWEIDKFMGRLYLIMAEVELPSLSHPYVMPKEIEEVLIMEVTGDPRFNNSEIAK